MIVTGSPKRGGKRPGSGRKLLPRAERVTGLIVGAQLIEALNKKASGSEPEEIKGWRKLWDADDLRVRLDVRKYLYDKRDGKATQPIDHGGGGPIKVEITTNVKMADPHDS